MDAIGAIYLGKVISDVFNLLVIFPLLIFIV